jgi:hypothetical protein
MLNQPWRIEVEHRAEFSVKGGRTRNKGLEWGCSNKPTTQRNQTISKQRQGKAQRVRVGVGQQAGLMGLRQYSKLNFPTLLGEELTRQSCSCRATQLQPGENNNTSDHLAQTGSELPQVPIAICPVEGTNY